MEIEKLEPKHDQIDIKVDIAPAQPENNVNLQPEKMIEEQPVQAIPDHLEDKKIPDPEPIKDELEEVEEPHISTIYEEFKEAIKIGNIKRVHELLEKYQQKYDLTNRLDSSSKQISTFTACLLTKEEESYEMLKILLQYNANPFFKDTLGQTVLFYVSREGKLKCLELLIDKGLRVEDQDEYGQTPLYYACREGRMDMVRKMIENGADVNHVDNINNQTALFYAAREGHYETCKYLLEQGCNLQHADSKKQTALNWAKRHSRKAVVDLFQEMGGLGAKDSKSKNKPKKSSNPNLNKANLQQFPGNNDVSEEKVENDQGSVAKEEIDDKSKVPGGTGSASIKGGSIYGDDKNAKKRKREKDEAKIAYKLVFTDESGVQRELSLTDFEKFRQEFPKVAVMLRNPDTTIDDTMIIENKEKESWEKIARKILTHIWKLKGAYLFHTPVDVVKLKIDDYFEIIKHPMDFGTIKAKLNNNVYISGSEFLHDMDLVFNNCILYNGADSEVGKVGIMIKREFDNQCKINNIYPYINDQKKENQHEEKHI